MSLNEIVANSNYITDEDLESANLLGMANTAIAEINARCGTKLPLYTVESITNGDYYSALSSSWQLALLEPYFSYSIMANDGDMNSRDFHYNRFLRALDNFQTKGMGELSSDVAGKFGKSIPIDVSNVTVHWEGWI